jgi:hypothetical protein
MGGGAVWPGSGCSNAAGAFRRRFNTGGATIRARPWTQEAARLAAVGAIICLMLAGCGDDKGTGPGNGSDYGLVFTRADSSRVIFPPSSATYIWCGEWEPGEVPVPALHVLVVMPAPAQGHWWLRAVVSDIHTGQPLPFPNDFIWDSPDSVHIFLWDDPNELATDTDDSGGTITFHRIPCPNGGTVDFSVDAVLGSELGDMPAVKMSGRFTGQVTAPPPGWDGTQAGARRWRQSE